VVCFSISEKHSVAKSSGNSVTITLIDNSPVSEQGMTAIQNIQCELKGVKYEAVTNQGCYIKNVLTL
jgi:hypothetical protein